MTNGDEFLIKILMEVQGDEQLRLLTEKLRETSKAAPRAGKAFAAAGKNTKNFGRIAQNTSFQLQDLIVQIGSGQDVTRALSQQLPQLFIGMGALGAAVGVVAAGLPLLIGLVGDSGTAAKDAAESWDEYTDALDRFTKTAKPVDAIIAGLFGERALEDRTEAIAQFRKQLEGLSDIGKVGAAREPAIVGQFGSIADFERYNQILSDMNAQNLDETAAKLGRLAAGMRGFANPETVQEIEDLVIGIREFNAATSGAPVASAFANAAIEANNYAQQLEEIKDAEFAALQAAIARDERASQARQREAEAARKRLRATLQPVRANQGNQDLIQRGAEFAQQQKAIAEANRQLAESYTMLYDPLAAYEAELANIISVQNELSPEVTVKAVEAAAEKFADATKEFSFAEEALMTFESTFETAVNGVAAGTQSISDAFENMAKSVIAQLLKIAAQQAVMSFFPGLSLTGAAQGAVMDNGKMTAFAQGGVVSRPTVFPMANGAGLMGEAGPEAIVPLSRSPNGNLGVESSPVNVVVNNNAPGVGVRTSQGENGLTIDIVMQQISTAISKGGNSVANALEESYSLGRGRAVY